MPRRIGGIKANQSLQNFNGTGVDLRIDLIISHLDSPSHVTIISPKQKGADCCPPPLLSTHYSLLPMPVHEFFHAMQSFFNLAVFSRIAHTRESFAAGTKRIARHHCYMFLF